MFNIILAHTRSFGIGLNGKLPWDLKDDLKYFKKITTTNRYDSVNSIIMGRKTADTLAKSLPNRENIVLTQNSQYREGFLLKSSFLDAIEHCIRKDPKAEIFVIGGAQIITESLKYPGIIKNIYLTEVKQDYECDVFVSDLSEYVDNRCELVSSEDYDTHINKVYKPTRGVHSEYQYIDRLFELLRAEPRKTRNAVTRSLFSTSITFDLQEGFPLLTTKKVFFNMIVKELLFFLGGCTDNSWLKSRGVHIWDGNTTREFIESCKLPYEEDTLGPMYGHQFRYFNAEYRGKDHDYTGEGSDQLAEVVDLLINDPHSRRILMTSYNYNQVKQGVLYPCFVENTPVLTSNGYKNIQDVDYTDKLLTHTGDFQAIIQLQKSKYNKENKLYRVRTRCSPMDIECTPEHPFYVKGGSEIQMKDPYYLHMRNAFWINAEELKQYHFIGMPINENGIIPRFQLDKTILFDVSHKDSYLLLGYFLANGWKDIDVPEKFYMLCDNENMIEQLLDKHGIMFEKNIEDNNMIYVCYDRKHSYIFKQFFDNNTCTVCSKNLQDCNKIIPEWLQDVPAGLATEFIKGYTFGVSGKLSTRCRSGGTVLHSTKSVKLAYGLQRLYLKVGIVVAISDIDDDTDLGFLSQHLYQIAVSKQDDYYLEQDYVWYKVRDVSCYSTDKSIDVYNFEVDTDNSYCVGNLIVHNCHSLVLQFYVREDFIDIQMYQRSADWFLGEAFNIASTSLLLEIIVNIVNNIGNKSYKAGKVNIVLGDYHLYDNHIRQALLQCSRIPREFCKLKITKPIDSIEPKYLLNIDPDIFKIEDYNPYPGIKAEMVA